MNYEILTLLAIAACLLAVRSELKFRRRLARIDTLRGEIAELSLAKDGQSRKSFHISELPKATIDAIGKAKMSSEHDHLNDLVDEDEADWREHSANYVVGYAADGRKVLASKAVARLALTITEYHERLKSKQKSKTSKKKPRKTKPY